MFKGTGTEHIKLLLDTSSTGGHRASVALESNSNEVSISTTGSDEMRFSTANTSDAIFIKSDGNVGIGTNNPTMGKLQVTGPKYVITNSGKALGGIHVNPDSGATLGQFGGAISLSAGGNGSSAIAAVNDGGSDNDSTGLAFFVHSSGTGADDATEVVRIDQIGNVGIGTDAPARHLVLYGTAASTTSIQFQNADTGAAAGDGFGVGLDSAEKGFIWNYEGNDTYIGGAGGTSITVQNGGNVGIGVTNPTTALHVNGAISLDYGTGVSYQGIKRTSVGNEYYVGTTSTGTHEIHTFTGSSAVKKMVILESGNVGIGTPTPYGLTHWQKSSTVNLKMSLQALINTLNNCLNLAQH